MSKPLDAVGTTGPIGKADFRITKDTLKLRLKTLTENEKLLDRCRTLFAEAAAHLAKLERDADLAAHFAEKLHSASAQGAAYHARESAAAARKWLATPEAQAVLAEKKEEK